MHWNHCVGISVHIGIIKFWFYRNFLFNYLLLHHRKLWAENYSDYFSKKTEGKKNVAMTRNEMHFTRMHLWLFSTVLQKEKMSLLVSHKVLQIRNHLQRIAWYHNGIKIKLKTQQNKKKTYKIIEINVENVDKSNAKIIGIWFYYLKHSAIDLFSMFFLRLLFSLNHFRYTSTRFESSESKQFTYIIEIERLNRNIFNFFFVFFFMKFLPGMLNTGFHKLRFKNI